MCGVGTGGTVTGTVRYLRERKPDLEVIGADPEGSIYSGGPENVRPYLVEGVGEDFWPETFDPSVVDRWITVSDRDAFLTTPQARADSRGSSPAGRAGSRSTRRSQSRRRGRGPEAMIVVILPDGGRSYLSKIYSDSWMRQYGFLERETELAVGDVLAHKRDAGEIPPLVTVETHQRVRDAVSLPARAPRLTAPGRQPARPGTVVGAISERGLLKRAAEDPSRLDAEIVEVMEPPFAAVSTRRSGARGGRASGRRPAGAARARRRPAGGHRHARRSVGSIGFVNERQRPRERFATRAVHAGLTPDPAFGSVIPAIHQT